MNKKSIDLQLFSNDFFGDEKPEVENPILQDTNDDIKDTASDDSTLEDNTVENDKNDETLNKGTDEKIEDTNENNQGFSEIKSQLDSILDQIQQQNVQEEESIEEVPKLTEEEIERLNNEFYLEFTQKPLEALQNLIDQEASRKVEPLKQYIEQMQQAQEWNKRIIDFSKENPDFNEHIDDITKLISEDEGIRSTKNPLEVAYKIVKAEKLEQQLQQTIESQNKPIDEIVKNQDTLKQLLQNKDIKNMIVKELMNETKDIPPVIGTDGGTSINVGQKPKSIEEATKAWLGE